MTISRNSLQIIIATIFCVSVPCFGLELHEAKPELKFVLGSEKRSWLIGGNKFGKGPIKPSHVAELFIRNLPKEQYQSESGEQYRPISNFSSFGVLKKLLETSAGQSMSQQQQDMVTTGNVICQAGKLGDVVGNHTHFRFYAVTQDDAIKISQAFVGFLIGKANENLEPLLIEQRELKKDIAGNKENGIETEAKLRIAKTTLDELKKTVHYTSIGEAQNTISSLNTRIDDLDIKLSAMRATQKATNQFLQEARKKSTTQNAHLKLEGEITKLTTKLEAVMAKNRTAVITRNRVISKLKTAQGNLDNLKKAVYDASGTETKGTLLDLYKAVNDFNGLFAGVLSELEATDVALEEETKDAGLDVELILEQKLREQNTELEAVEASKETATALREQAERFYYLAEQVSQLHTSKKTLSTELLDAENALTHIEEELATPGSELLPPEVYQNKVTIYPVHSGFSFESTQ